MTKFLQTTPLGEKVVHLFKTFFTGYVLSVFLLAFVVFSGNAGAADVPLTTSPSRVSCI